MTEEPPLALPDVDQDMSIASAASEPQGLPFDDDGVDFYLLVGSDQDKVNVDVGQADAVLLFLRPHGGERPMLMSLPRDLLLMNPCTRAPAQLKATLEGCGERVSGPELLAVVVEDFTGLSVDHFAVLSFGAFGDIIDRLGGIQICLSHDLRLDSKVTLTAGCGTADGQAALAWIRSRTPEELIDGEWRPAEGGDLARSERQQTMLVQLLSRLRRFQSPLELSGLIRDMSDAVALDESLTLGRAIDVAWSLRSIEAALIVRPTLAVRDLALRGQFVRFPAETFADVIARVYASG